MRPADIISSLQRADCREDIELCKDYESLAERIKGNFMFKRCTATIIHCRDINAFIDEGIDEGCIKGTSF